MAEHTMNSQITDAMTQLNTLMVGESAPQSMALMNAVMTDTLGMAMHNAVSTQHHAQMIGGASATSACARMLSILAPPPQETNGAQDASWNSDSGSNFFNCNTCNPPGKEDKNSISKLKQWFSDLFSEQQKQESKKDNGNGDSPSQDEEQDKSADQDSAQAKPTDQDSEQAKPADQDAKE